MSRSLVSIFAGMAFAVGSAGAAFAASATGMMPPVRPVPLTRPAMSAMPAPTVTPADNGRCPVLYSEPGHDVFGGAGCAGGGGPNQPRDRSGRLE